MKYLRIGRSFLFLLILFAACKKKDSTPAPVTITNELVTLNPTGYAPLTAAISLSTSPAVKISILVVGKHGAESDVVKDLIQ